MKLSPLLRTKQGTAISDSLWGWLLGALLGWGLPLLALRTVGTGAGWHSRNPEFSPKIEVNLVPFSPVHRGGRIHSRPRSVPADVNPAPHRVERSDSPVAPDAGLESPAAATPVPVRQVAGSIRFRPTEAWLRLQPSGPSIVAELAVKPTCDAYDFGCLADAWHWTLDSAIAVARACDPNHSGRRKVRECDRPAHAVSRDTASVLSTPSISVGEGWLRTE